MISGKFRSSNKSRNSFQKHRPTLDNMRGMDACARDGDVVILLKDSPTAGDNCTLY